MFVLVEQLGNELIWLEWMLGNPGARPVRQDLELLQRAVIAAMDSLMREQPDLPNEVLHDINQHFQAIRNAIANNSESLGGKVQTACRALDAL